MQILLDSLWTSLFGILVVFAVLIGLIVLVKLLNLALVGSRKPEQAETNQPAPVASAQIPSFSPADAQTLKLTDVDEQTAAIIMAIVCDQLGASPSELYFKSIRLLNGSTPAQN